MSEVFDEDAEAAVLGALVLDQKSYWKVADIISAEDFAVPRHRQLYRVMEQLCKDGVDCDVITIGEKLPDRDSRSFVVELANTTPSAANARNYAKVVARFSQQRKVAHAGEQISQLRGDDIYQDAQRILSSCMRKTASVAKKVGDVFLEAFRSISERSLANAGLPGLPTGLTDLDEMISGLQPDSLIIIAARPSVGKTALAAQICMHVAKYVKKSALLISMEMSARQITDRFIAHIAKIDSKKLGRPDLMADEEWKRFFDSAEVFRDLPLFIDEDSTNVEEISARAYQAKITDDIALLAIDYLQLMDLPPGETTAERMQILTRSFKQLAKRLHIPVVLLSQLSREGADKPQMHHLRSSGAIEQDADVVILLHKPNATKWPNRISVNVAKNRNGPTGELLLTSRMAISTFLNYASDDDDALVERYGGFE